MIFLLNLLSIWNNIIRKLSVLLIFISLTLIFNSYSFSSTVKKSIIITNDISIKKKLEKIDFYEIMYFATSDIFNEFIKNIYPNIEQSKNMLVIMNISKLNLAFQSILNNLNYSKNSNIKIIVIGNIVKLLPLKSNFPLIVEHINISNIIFIDPTSYLGNLLNPILQHNANGWLILNLHNTEFYTTVAITALNVDSIKESNYKIVAFSQYGTIVVLEDCENNLYINYPLKELLKIPNSFFIKFFNNILNDSKCTSSYTY